METRPGDSKALELRLSRNEESKVRTSALEEWWTSAERNGEQFIARRVRWSRIPSDYWEDICQDVYMILLKAIKAGKYTYQDGTPFEAYVTPFIKGAVRSFWEESGRSVTAHTPLDEMPQRFLEDDAQSSPFEQIERRELLETTLGCFARLSPRRQEVLLRWCQGDKGLDEISEEMGVDYQIVRKDKSVAIQQLRRMLGDDLDN